MEEGHASDGMDTSGWMFARLLPCGPEPNTTELREDAATRLLSEKHHTKKGNAYPGLNFVRIFQPCKTSRKRRRGLPLARFFTASESPQLSLCGVVIKQQDDRNGRTSLLPKRVSA